MSSPPLAGVVAPLSPGEGPLSFPHEKFDVGAVFPHRTDPLVVPAISVLGFDAAGRLGNISSLARGPIVRGAAVEGTPRMFEGVGRDAAVPVAQARGSRIAFRGLDGRAG